MKSCNISETTNELHERISRACLYQRVHTAGGSPLGVSIAGVGIAGESIAEVGIAEERALRECTPSLRRFIRKTLSLESAPISLKGVFLFERAHLIKRST